MVSVEDYRRHAPTARVGASTAHISTSTSPLYRGAKARGYRRDMYVTDHADQRHGGKFRWLISTCLAATVGAIAIIVVIFGAADRREHAEGLLPALKRLQETATPAPVQTLLRDDDGLKWAIPKRDRLVIPANARSTRYIIHETLRKKKAGREYIYAKPYVRIVSKLAPVPSEAVARIPAFNPVTIYKTNSANSRNTQAQRDNGSSDVVTKVLELLTGALPTEDAQELEEQEVEALVIRAENWAALSEQTEDNQLAEQSSGNNDASDKTSFEAQFSPAPNTTILKKSSTDDEARDGDDDAVKPIVRTVRKKQKLRHILGEAGANIWQTREMIEAMKAIMSPRDVTAGQEVHILLQPSLTKRSAMEPAAFSIYDQGHAHKVTVKRTSSGEFTASDKPITSQSLLRLASKDQSANSTLYTSLYHASLLQSIDKDTIDQIIRIHAHETDFRRRLRSDDTWELFFDLKDEAGRDGPPGELLYSSISSSDITSKYYRFKTRDGVVDYYDTSGNNARKFLIRRPVRGDNVRLTSGFGLRFHPLLNRKRMHNGVDWAARPGTPIIAAGTGVIEEAGRKGHYGNYVRIRHANGYRTSYGHMKRIARGISRGGKVRQGQLIGYVGSTGLSSGPHLHFEVLINKRHVNPMSIKVPRERKLTGRDLTRFKAERARIDSLIRRTPVMAYMK